MRPRLCRLEPRLTPDNTLTLAGDANAVQFAPDGRLVQLVYRGDDLVYRTRSGGGFAEELVTPVEPTGFQPRRTDQAQLVFAGNVPHVFKLTNGSAIDHFARAGNTWQFVETLAPPTPGPAVLEHLVAAAAPGGGFRLVWTEYSPFTAAGTLRAARSGEAWQFSTVADLGERFQATLGQADSPRFFDLATDAAGVSHVVYPLGFTAEGTVKNSRLVYANDAGGSWTSTTIAAPADGSGDTGLGASIAVGPGGLIGIAHLAVDRATDGRPVAASLFYSSGFNGQFTAEVVATAGDAYASADGPLGTGANPDVAFDAAGRAVIAFSDFAGNHAGTNFNEFAGQVRLATRTAAGWQVQTLLKQTDPVFEQTRLPTLAVSAGEYVVAALRRQERLDEDGFFLDSLYTLETLTAAPPGGAPVPPPVTPPPVTPPPPRESAGAFVAAADAGGGPHVRVFNDDGEVVRDIFPYPMAFTGGVRLAAADFDGDGVRDVVTVPGPGGGPHVRAFSGSDGGVILEYLAYAAEFVGGLWVAAGDVTGDGVADVITGADAGGGPHVVVYDVAERRIARDFFAFDINFRGGVRVAAGDLDGDGSAEVVAAPGVGGGPNVRAFDGRSGATVRDFFAYDPAFGGGVYIAAGDLDGDGRADIVSGAGAGGGPHVRGFRGTDGAELLSVVSAVVTGGARVAVRAATGEIAGAVLVGGGPGSSPVVSWLSLDGRERGRTGVYAGGFLGGVFVG